MRQSNPGQTTFVLTFHYFDYRDTPTGKVSAHRHAPEFAHVIVSQTAKRYLVNPGRKIRDNTTPNFVASTRSSRAEANYFIVIVGEGGGARDRKGKVRIARVSVGGRRRRRKGKGRGSAAAKTSSSANL